MGDIRYEIHLSDTFIVIAVAKGQLLDPIATYRGKLSFLQWENGGTDMSKMLMERLRDATL